MANEITKNLLRNIFINRKWFVLLCLIGVLWFQIKFDGATAVGQEPRPPSDNGIIDFWLKVSRDAAQSYEISTTDSPIEKLRLFENPVFRHTQPTRGDDIGAMHLWIDSNDRPAAIGVMFAYSVNGQSRRVIHEFHSLTNRPISARSQERQIWNSNEDGLTWISLNDPSLIPANDKRRRSLQARQIARKFEANTTDPTGSKRNIEVVATPIYEYEYKAKPDETCDGFLFAFCHGTDTEILLALENRKEESESRWHYAFAQFTDYEASVSLDKNNVWNGPRNPGLNGRKHFIRGAGDIAKPDFERK